VNWVWVILAGLGIPTVLIYLWLEYGVTEYCLGCGKGRKDHPKGLCVKDTRFSKVLIALGLTLAANMVFLGILLLISVW